MIVLGISAFYHDSAACLVRDGEIVAAAQEERFTRIKNDAAFPRHAVAFCLAEAGVRLTDVDIVAFYEKPLLLFDRILETQLAEAPRGFGNAKRALPVWLRKKLRHRKLLRDGLAEVDPAGWSGRFVFTRHHDSHAASAFFPSPFDEAAIVTVDGVGEWSTCTIGRGEGKRVTLTHEQRFPHSLGLLYSAFTAYCGFKVNHGEYKLMGLAPYGEPRFAERIAESLIDLKEDGSFKLNMEHFAFTRTNAMFGPSFERLFEGPPRPFGGEITQRHMDVARSIQAVTEQAMLGLARKAHAETGSRNLVMAGGVALNCVANGRIQREGPFDRVWIQPAAGDAGGALGAALFVWHQLLGEARAPGAPDSQHGSLLGPSFSDAEIDAALGPRAGDAERYDSDEALAARVAELLEAGKTVGHFAGRTEFGPRALGARSILADARSPETQRVLNLKIKFRESFRPFAPIVLAEHAPAYFETGGAESPYMLVVSPVAASRRGAWDDARGFDKLRAVASEIPAVTHVDGSARVQTVDARHGRIRGVLEAFERRTGMPVLVNTSFNVRGEPIVNRPEEALACFDNTNMDALVLERTVLLKADDAPPVEEPADLERPDAAEHGGLVDFDWTPDDAKLRRFGFLAVAVFGALAWAMWSGRFVGAHVPESWRPTLSVAMACVAGVSGLLSLVWPRGNRVLWLSLTALAFPIGTVMSWVLMATIFYGVMTPIGVVMRLLGRDPLDRAVDENAPSYWREMGPAPDAASYFRQF